MARKETIEIMAKLVDNVTGKAKQVTKSIQTIQGATERVVTTTDRWNKSGKKMSTTLTKTTQGLKRFSFEWLGIMFAGMALLRVFGGLIRSQLELWGVTEGFSGMLAVLFAPMMEKLVDLLFPIMDWFMNLPEPVQELIGWIVLLVAGLGLFLMVIGQLALGLGSIKLLLGGGGVGGALLKMGGLLKGIIVFFTGLGIVALAVVAVVVSVVVGMWLAWKENFLGMRNTVANFIKGVKSIFQGLINIISGILDIIVGIFTGDWDKAIEGVKKILRGLMQFITGVFIGAINLVLGIITGAIKIIANIIKFIIDGIKWTIGKVGGFIGGILGFQDGGVVPGRLGQPVPAIVHGGERIIPANRSDKGGGGPINITVNANVSSDYDVRRLGDQIKKVWVSDFERITKSRGTI